MLSMRLTSGAAIAPSVEVDAEGLVNWGVVEWTTPDPATEAAMASADEDGNPRAVTVKVDASSTPPKLTYTYAPVDAGGVSDMQAALNLLGVEVE
jgi:hypothetical protein